MPRRIDHSAIGTAETYDRFGLFVPFLDGEGKSAPRLGRGELTEQDLWPGDSFFNGVSHQYDLRTPEGVNPYDNSLVDGIHAWLGEHCAGAWNWFESECNNYRSLSASVYIREPEDQAKFEAAWGHLFERREWAFEHNAKLASKTESDEAAAAPSP